MADRLTDKEKAQLERECEGDLRGQWKYMTAPDAVLKLLWELKDIQEQLYDALAQMDAKKLGEQAQLRDRQARIIAVAKRAAQYTKAAIEDAIVHDDAMSLPQALKLTIEAIAEIEGEKEMPITVGSINWTSIVPPDVRRRMALEFLDAAIELRARQVVQLKQEIQDMRVAKEAGSECAWDGCLHFGLDIS